MRVFGPSSASCSLCRYANGETKSKYQSIGRHARLYCSGDSAAAARDGLPHRAARVVVEHAPHRDLVERAQAPFAKAGRVVHAADADARRRHAPTRKRPAPFNSPARGRRRRSPCSPRSSARILAAICATVSSGIVSPATCGVIVISGRARTDATAGNGSSRKTSSVAPDELALVEQRDQVLVDEEVAAADVDDVRTVGEAHHRRAIEQARRLRGRRQHADDEVEARRGSAPSASRPRSSGRRRSTLALRA